MADTFDSKQVSGLLRSAPNLSPNIEHVEDMFVKPGEESEWRIFCLTSPSWHCLAHSIICIIETDELLPRDGKDAAYDEIVEEIEGLQSKLEKQLEKLEQEAGCVRPSVY